MPTLSDEVLQTIAWLRAMHAPVKLAREIFRQMDPETLAAASLSVPNPDKYALLVGQVNKELYKLDTLLSSLVIGINGTALEVILEEALQRSRLTPEQRRMQERLSQEILDDTDPTFFDGV